MRRSHVAVVALAALSFVGRAAAEPTPSAKKHTAASLKESVVGWALGSTTSALRVGAMELRRQQGKQSQVSGFRLVKSQRGETSRRTPIVIRGNALQTLGEALRAQRANASQAIRWQHSAVVDRALANIARMDNVIVDESRQQVYGTNQDGTWRAVNKFGVTTTSTPSGVKVTRYPVGHTQPLSPRHASSTVVVTESVRRKTDPRSVRTLRASLEPSHPNRREALRAGDKVSLEESAGVREISVTRRGSYTPLIETRPMESDLD